MISAQQGVDSDIKQTFPARLQTQSRPVKAENVAGSKYVKYDVTFSWALWKLVKMTLN